ncbi:MAG: SDR family oxidoreductase [Spirochaetaceae bacterium]|nr:SDR family oxidoreductase [Spirochaetaceae bacterium]
MSDAPGIALVTGAAGGIGRAVVERLVRDGMRVGALDVNAEGLVALAADRPDVLALTADVTDEDEIRAAFEALRGQWGEPDVVVNVAGYFARHRVPDLSRSEWDRFLAVNATGPFLVCREALPAMIAAGAGCIVNIASTAGLQGGRDRAAYCAAKGALVQLTRSLAIDHGPDGVRINAVAPGLIDTEMADWIRHDPAALAGFEASLPAGRMGTVEEVADTVAYLVSPAATYVMGATVAVDGGSSA